MCPSTEWYTGKMEHYSALKKKDIVSLTTTWMHPEDTILTNKPVTKGQILYDSNYMRHREWSNSETKRMVVIRCWGKGRKGELLLNW